MACVSLTTAGFAGLSATSPGLDKVTLRLKWLHQFQFAGYYAAIDQGYYRNAGLEVELIEDNGEEESVQTVTSNRAQFGIGGTELLLHRARGTPIVALAAIFQHSPLVFLVPKGSVITNIHQLAGKRVMLEKHSAELLAYLRAEGLTMEDLEILPHSYGVNELLEGKADAISAYLTDEPFNIVAKNLDYSVFMPQSSGIDFYCDILFTSEEQIKNHPQRVKAFLEASKKGWEYALEHPEEIADLILSRYSKRHSREHLLFEAEKTKTLIRPDVVEIGYMNIGRWQHIADKYHELGMLPADVSLDGFIYSPDNENVASWSLLLQFAEIVFALFSLFFVVRMIRAHISLEILYRKNSIVNRKLKRSRRRFSMLISNMPGMAYKCRLDKSWTMKYVSPGCLALTGYQPSEILNNARIDFASLILPEDRERVRIEIAKALSLSQPFNVTYRIVTANGEQKWVWEQGRLAAIRKKNQKTSVLEGFITDVSEAKNLESANQKAITDLQQALREIKVLRGIIPICSSCKKIRDDKGLWSQIEKYIKEHTGSEFSHSICPECAARLYPKNP
ncbi:MAG: ABC transporter substrate-binding protein [Candidatus Riflebacteria bacterium]|nr:ABC transporter substrate-binding protein [Candidatus Riflebacteria bacterium]